MSKETDDNKADAGEGLLSRFGTVPDSFAAATPHKLYRAMIVPLRSLRRQRILVNDTTKIAEMLESRAAEFSRPKEVPKESFTELGRTIFEAGPEQYARIRPLVELAYSPAKMKRYLPRVLEAGEEAIARLAKAEGPVDIAAEMQRLATDVSLRIVLSLNVGEGEGGEIAALLPDVATRMARTGMVSEFGGKDQPKGKGSDGKALAAALDAHLEARVPGIAEFKGPADVATDLMLTQHPETWERLDAGFVRHQVTALLVHGSEALAAALSWALYATANDPEIEARAGIEARTALEATGPLEFRTLARLRLIPDILNETFRLYPPIPLFARRPRQVELVTDIAVRESGFLFISPWHLGRHEAHWEEPERFDPDRWQRKSKGTAPGHHFVPFSEGTRRCPGAGMARLDCMAILTQILGTFHLSALPERIPTPQPGLALRPKDGIWLNVARR